MRHEPPAGVAHEIIVRTRTAAPEQRAVDAPLTVGGSRADGLFLGGLAPGALRLVPCAAGLVVEVSVAGARVGGRVVAAGERRLLRPGEEVELPGAVLALAAAAHAAVDGTRAAAAVLLRGAAVGELVAGTALLVLSGPAAGARLPLGVEATIGRGRSATIRLLDPKASRVHARLRADPRGVTVEDLGSKNGVRVGGVRIEARRAHPLTPSQELRIGDTLLALLEAPPRAPSADARRERGAPRGRAVALRLAAAALLAVSAAALVLAGS